MTYVFDIEELPLDTPEEDADNALLAPDGKPVNGDPSLNLDGIVENVKRELSLATARATSVYVPFKRSIKLGSVGPDCYAVKRALSKAGFGPWGGWGRRPRLFGPYAVRNLKSFQRKNRLKADGVYGRETHRKLAPYFDDYGRWLLGQTKILTTSDMRRQVIVSTAMHGFSNRYGIHYTQSWMRMQGVKQRLRPPAYPKYEDCSSFATWCYWVAGASDPNGLGYNGYGYTGTLANNGRKISSAYMKPGDLIFFGRYPHNHVTIYVGNGRSVSHGNEAGPQLLTWNYRTVNHVRSYF